MTAKQTHEDNQRDRSRPPRVLIWVLIVAAIASLVIVLPYFVNFGGAWAVKLEDWGLAGDYIGGTLSAVFAFLALLVLSWSVHLQLDEMRRTTALLEEQSKEAKRQSDKSTFFALLATHNANLNALQVGAEAYSAGRGAMKQIARRGIEIINRGGVADKPGVASAFVDFYGDYSHVLGHYYRTLFYLFKFIEDSPYLSKDPLYVKIVRAQMSDDEVLLMFMNGLSPQGEEMKPYIVRHQLLWKKILRNFGNPNALEALYPAKAYRQ